MTEPRLAVVAGGLGVIGHAVAEHLASRGDGGGVRLAS